MSEAGARPIYTDPNKLTTLDELAGRAKDGAVVAVGGGLSSREPMAVLRAILNQGLFFAPVCRHHVRPLAIAQKKKTA
jgi:glutaconate CoA-transferase subunit A